MSSSVGRVGKVGVQGLTDITASLGGERVSIAASATAIIPMTGASPHLPICPSPHLHPSAT